MYCRECGLEVSHDANFCQSCGCSLLPGHSDGVSRNCQKVDSQNKPVQYYQIVRSPGFAAVASFFIPGLGEIYTGKILAGLSLMLIEAFVLIVTVIIPPVVFIYLAIWVYSIHDSYNKSLQFDDKL